MTDTTNKLLDDRLFELLELVRDADSVELKLTVPNAAQAQVVRALGIDPLDAQIRQVFFFDTPDLELNAVGVVARARRIQGKGDDSVIKLRPVVPNELPADVRTSPNVVVEVDAMPGGFVCSAAMKNRLDATAVRMSALGNQPLRKLFSKEQRAFYAAHAPNGIELDALSILGPIFVLKISHMPEGLTNKFATELWLYPDGARILELSTKSAPADLGKTLLNVRAFLADRGIETTGEQQTKTKTALEYFSGELRKSAGADG